MEAYRGGKSTKDAQFEAKKYGSHIYTFQSSVATAIADGFKKNEITMGIK